MIIALLNLIGADYTLQLLACPLCLDVDDPVSDGALRRLGRAIPLILHAEVLTWKVFCHNDDVVRHLPQRCPLPPMPECYTSSKRGPWYEADSS